MLAAVIVTINEPAVEEVHCRLAVAGDGGSVMLVGLIALQVRPLGRGLSESATVPAK